MTGFPAKYIALSFLKCLVAALNQCLTVIGSVLVNVVRVLLQYYCLLSRFPIPVMPDLLFL